MHGRNPFCERRNGWGNVPVRTLMRKLLFIIALLLIAAGVANGGMREVWIKAVNICTECIGLG